ncbi:glutamate/tyrosine decarboxylase-like PLP-dependent enzyme [Lewinella marina]|uniref:Pyridoxal-dependent decarboxylase n=1 Tax=Neolewinella marina TaxID=438751 RepID=A0A2G0CBK3_9BACT|nr:aminotransferase class I/II-fold pyridoxal phosphate-dependent enzyme [Neolewinella marina]NJB87132.1 glutamate/tyrosine decarboxylase-like PLP-dependent enzyme [Neolewinella marina]PHK97341.1 pyridoxal-dependent decarboxylase [Neolewinella marina]
MTFDLTPDQRQQLLNDLLSRLEDYYTHTRDHRVAPDLDPEQVRDAVAQYDFSRPLPADEAIGAVVDNLLQHQVHVPHPRYYGLYNPRANFPSILADLIAAYFNPQLAAWSHSPYAAEVETHLIQEYGKRFGYPGDVIDGTFTTGGAEANLTGILCALNHRFPDYANRGFRAFGGEPVIYCSDQAHHSVVKAARVVGLGLDSVVQIPVDEQLRMEASALKEQLARDRANGKIAVMVIATAGTTGTATLDPLPEIADVCQQAGVWLHVDAAFGGAAVLHPDYRPLLRGIEVADSITTDIHKWLSVPMGTGMFLTRHPDILSKTFRTTAEYMPREGGSLSVVDPYTHTIQWSRRFLGLRMYLSLLVFGWEGYAETIRHHVEMGDYLRQQLTARGWMIAVDTPLPVVCFTWPGQADPGAFARDLCARVVASGEAWISVYPIRGVDVLRACITNYATTREDIDALVGLLDRLRRKLGTSAPPPNFTV